MGRRPIKLSNALLAAIAKARSLARHKRIGREFRELVLEARDLHKLMVEALIHAAPRCGESHRDFCESIDRSLEQLEALLDLPNCTMR